MAGLDPAIHVFLGGVEEDVDTRVKPAHDGVEGWAEDLLRAAFAVSAALPPLAIQRLRLLDCFAALAMTGMGLSLWSDLIRRPRLSC